MPQSAIGPGMGVFSRYKAVLESDDSPMSVKTALQLINRELDEYLGGIQGEFDADTRFAITWFEQNGTGKGDYGVADNLARARGISVDSVKHAGSSKAPPARSASFRAMNSTTIGTRRTTAT
jgi:putative DNA methylase